MRLLTFQRWPRLVQCTLYYSYVNAAGAHAIRNCFTKDSAMSAFILETKQQQQKNRRILYSRLINHFQKTFIIFNKILICMNIIRLILPSAIYHHHRHHHHHHYTLFRSKRQTHRLTMWMEMRRSLKETE